MVNKFEKMDDFFNKRAISYDQHMRENVADFDIFYKNISEPITKTTEEINILDLGCGTGLELEYVFNKAPQAQVTCLDLSEKMFNKLKNKFNHKKDQIEMIVGSYLEENLEIKKYDYIISVMTVHHLNYDYKLKLYKKIKRALKKNGQYIEGDYVVSLAKEKKFLEEYNQISSKIKGAKQGIYHIDIPFSLKTQRKLSIETGFKKFNLIYKKGEAAVYSMAK